MYQSEWTDKPVLHLLPHWNWQPGQAIDVWAWYSKADEVELFLNGRSLGAKRKSDSTLHVQWQVPFEPGTLKAISRKNGKPVLISEIKTTGPAAGIELKAEKQSAPRDANALWFIDASITDKNGNYVPEANNRIQFSVSQNAVIVGTDNGYQADTSSLTNPVRHAWKGKALVVIRPLAKKGNITLTAQSPGWPEAVLHLRLPE